MRCRYLKGLFQEQIDLGDESKKKGKTLGWQFKSSLDALMTTLRKCHPWFVRCVKPNENKAAGEFDRLLCTRQLRYSGMMETIRIRKAGYPIRHTFAEAINRYVETFRACAWCLVFVNTMDDYRGSLFSLLVYAFFFRLMPT